MLQRRKLLSLAALAPFAPSAHASGNWPTRPIRILSAGGVGGTNYVLARHLVEPLTKLLGQPIVVEANGGAGGAIATQFVLQQPADGYTILTHHNGLVTTPLLRPNAGYALKNLIPVSQQGSSPLVLMAHPSMPATLPEFIAFAKAHPGKLEWGTAALGGLSHLSTEVLHAMADIKDMVRVAFTGSVPAIQALVGGQIKYMLSVPSAVTAGLAKEGRIRYLGVSYAQRTPSLPELPAIAEAVPGFAAEAWYGMLAKAGTPDDILEKLATAFSAVLTQPGVVEQYAAVNVLAKPGRNELAAIMQREAQMWGRVVQEKNIRLE